MSTSDAIQKANIAAALENNIKKPISDTTLIFIAIGAFAFGSFLFTGINLFKQGKYKDWSVNIKDGCLNLLEKKKKADAFLLDSIQRQDAQRLKVNLVKDTISKRIELLDAEIFRIETSWDSSNAVVPSNFRSSILFKKSSMASPAGNFEEDTVLFYYQITDTSRLVKTIRVPGFLTPFRSETREKNIEIFRKYPTTGFWSVLSIAQLVFWAIICIASISLLKNLYTDMNKKSIVPEKHALWKIGMATGATIGVFILVFFLCIYDQQYRFSNIFMYGFEWGMQFYGLVGYITAGILLYSFLLTAYYVQQSALNYAATLKKQNEIRVKLTEKLRQVEELKAQLKDLGSEIPVRNTQVDDLKSNSENTAKDLALLKDQYKTCKQYFNFFFALAAVVLSVLVIWIGGLFASINSMELFTFLRMRTGYSYIPYDFVYLYGALHSLLLFIFYVPVKLRLLSMSFSIPEEKQEDGKTTKDTFKKIFVRFIEILAASSPLLTAILQKLFE